MFYYMIALAIIIFDQLTKWIVVKEMELGESIPVIDNFLYITSHRNRGAAWGILQGQMWFFYVITIIVVIGLIVYIRKINKADKWLGVALGLMLGGAIGNFIDRVFRQEVVDFVNTYIFTYDFPIFNVADSALVVGVGIMFILTLFEGKQKKESTKE
ncbi:signal peptidase II [Priestia flexa]|uniref:Lipoprotein signal peptidase n=2 Tax=Priestia TaxID=2800373 RepID=A0A0V8JRV1_9BACI|nr:MULTISPECIES: signal peptidase II [Bacillaceae]AQX53976.1 signal peptidase II [Priestia flexa]KSU89733.1 signal peptidase II [Priestia veravalensis]KZB93342.1 signal peptidase II [Bacillus sp. VT 712]MBN8250158.1 signal peptidase II [Priestia flexa]MBN8434519.1 signal peptidase II [Priestia flexa]